MKRQMCSVHAALVMVLLVFWCPQAFGTPEIHVAWGLLGTPDPGIDYRIDTTDPNYPSIELITGDTTWQIWSRDSVTGQITDIGTISAYGYADYGLRIVDLNGVPGARNVKSIVLTPGGNHYSGINAYSAQYPSRITGDLAGSVTLLKNTSDVGGYCQITVDGDITGKWSAPGPAYIRINGDVKSSASLELGHITGAFVEISGNVDGDITVVQGMHGGTNDAELTIDGNLNADITIGSMSCTQPYGLIDITIGGDCSGNIEVLDGLPTSVPFPDGASINILGQLTSSGVIDFAYHDFDGDLTLTHGGAGSIKNVGDVSSTGSITLGTSAGDTFSGSLQVFTSFLGMGGSIQTGNIGSGA